MAIALTLAAPLPLLADAGVELLGGRTHTVV